MRDALAASSAADVTLTLTHEAEKIVSDTALVLYRAFHEVCVEAAALRRYHPRTTHVTVFCPVEVAAVALGVHRSTVWRAVKVLRSRGLVDMRAHKSTLRGQTVNDGALWCVRLNPHEGKPARLTYDELKHTGWRDLARDVRAGRTAWAVMQQSKDSPRDGLDIDLIRSWALPPTHSAPVNSDCCTTARHDLEAVLDVPHAPKDERGAAVEGAAAALAGHLRDRGSVAFYQKLLWQLLRVHDRGGAAPFNAVYEQARRAGVDAVEGFARRPGALFVSRLKAAPWWEGVMRAEGRVAVRPMRA